jgi:tetratricopeptide (TPR) repeat protein
LSSLDNKVPRALSDIVAKCLERDAKLRYSSAKELLSDLEAWQGKSAAASIRLPDVQPWGRDIPWIWISVAAAVLILAVAGFLLRAKLFGPAPGSGGPVVSLAILPFNNASKDPKLDWLGPALAEMLRTDMGESSAMRTVASDRVNQILNDLRIAPNSALDPDTMRRVADFTNADRLLSAQYAQFGNQIRIDATLQDIKRQRNVSLSAQAASDKDLPAAIKQLAEAVRNSLQLSAGTIKEMQSKSFRPSSQSVQALGDYDQGLQLSRRGKYLEAVKQFEAATAQDPKFALAYAELGKTYAALGYADKAQDASRQAMDLSDQVSPQEKFLIQAENAQAVKDYPKAIEAYENLARMLPDDADVQYALARLYEDSGSPDKAGAYYAKLLQADPKHIDALLHMGWVQIRRNNFQGGLDYLNRGLTLSVQLGNDEEKALILDGMGNAYLHLNKFDDALRNYQDALATKQRLGNKPGVAETLNWIAEAQQSAGKPDQAIKSYKDALDIYRQLGDKLGQAGDLLDQGNLLESIGKYDDALSATKEALPIFRNVGDRQNEANCLNNIGWIYLDKTDYDNAMTFFQQALDIRQKVGAPGDVADTTYNIGETYLHTGHYNDAMDHYLKSLELWRKSGDQRGIAFASYGLGRVFLYQGRYGAALNSEQDAFKNWQAVGEQGFWLPQIQASYGNALASVGRSDEAQKNLDQALILARTLKNDPLVAHILNFQGDRLFYAGDYRGAAALYQQASQAATRAKDREQTLISKSNLAKVSISQGRGREVIPTLKALSGQAAQAGLQYLSVDCSLYLAQAFIEAKDYSHAREQLDNALHTSESSGLKVLLAKSNYLTGTVLRLTGNPSAGVHYYAQARSILDDVQKEAHADGLLKRSDLAAMYEDSGRYSHP